MVGWLCHLMEIYEAFKITASSRLGVKTRVFHLGDYRRAMLGHGQEVPDDYFFVNGWVDNGLAIGFFRLTWHLNHSIRQLCASPPKSP